MVLNGCLQGRSAGNRRGGSRLWLGTLLFTGLLALIPACRTQSPAPVAVTAPFQRQLNLAGKQVLVNLYLPPGTNPAPTVVVAHGFTRTRLNMAGWGRFLATNGFIVAVPDLPAFANPKQNGRAVNQLLDLLNSGVLVDQPRPSGSGALVGFSMGGLATLLAASANSNATCWVGLDPVDSGRVGAKAARTFDRPCLVLRAAPAACNSRGNARNVVAALAGPVVALQVQQATHSDAESPTDPMAEWVCGKADPDRHQVFERYTLAALRAALCGDLAALESLKAATNDPAVTDVTIRWIDDFCKPVRRAGGNQAQIIQ
jgi:pimeloyl-ACP methyl ester carboxylesterase